MEEDVELMQRKCTYAQTSQIIKDAIIVLMEIKNWRQIVISFYAPMHLSQMWEPLVPTSYIDLFSENLWCSLSSFSSFCISYTIRVLVQYRHRSTYGV